MQETTDLSGNLIDSILAFCKQTKMAESTFGRRAVNDEKFVPRLRNGSGSRRRPGSVLQNSFPVMSPTSFPVKGIEQQHGQYKFP